MKRYDVVLKIEGNRIRKLFNNEAKENADLLKEGADIMLEYLKGPFNLENTEICIEETDEIAENI